MTRWACRHCDGVGTEPLPVNAERVLAAIGSNEVHLAADLALTLGLTHQRTDGILQELRRAGLVVRLPRTAQGYEWVGVQ